MVPAAPEFIYRSVQEYHARAVSGLRWGTPIKRILVYKTNWNRALSLCEFFSCIGVQLKCCDVYSRTGAKYKSIEADFMAIKKYIDYGGASTEGFVTVRQTRKSVRMRVVWHHGDFIDDRKYSRENWSLDAAANQIREHGLSRVWLNVRDVDRNLVQGFADLGIEIAHTISPKSSRLTSRAETVSRKLKRPPIGSRVSLHEHKKIINHLVAEYRGIVESTDEDGHSTTVIEDEYGQSTEVRFETVVLQKRGIEADCRFYYRVYQTPSGGKFTLSPWKAQTLTLSEWEVLGQEAREIAAMLPDPERHAV
ncbi:MAG: hypothetical protein ABIY70_00470 [Capsulimonas sp.]|uniref:hypothetical protein n=1 Tax=Capsulimonas sp. TaxID=2494211 RepID=UPI003263C49A